MQWLICEKAVGARLPVLHLKNFLPQMRSDGHGIINLPIYETLVLAYGTKELSWY